MAYAWSPGPGEDQVDPSFWDPVNPGAMPAAQTNPSTPGRPIQGSRGRAPSTDSVELTAAMYDDTPKKRGRGLSSMSESVNMSMSLKPVLFDTPPRSWVKPARPASLFSSESILGLDKDNFYDAILKKEKALVLFGDSRVPRSGRIDLAFLHAAERTKNEKYQFGFVDCAYNMPFCKQQKICKVPSMKLYSNGFEVSKMEDLTHFNAAHLRKLMTMAPVLKLPKQTTQYIKMLEKPKSRSASLETLKSFPIQGTMSPASPLGSTSEGLLDWTQDAVFDRTAKTRSASLETLKSFPIQGTMSPATPLDSMSVMSEGLTDWSQDSVFDSRATVAKNAGKSLATIPERAIANLADKSVARVFETPEKKKKKGLFGCRCLGF